MKGKVYSVNVSSRTSEQVIREIVEELEKLKGKKKSNIEFENIIGF